MTLLEIFKSPCRRRYFSTVFSKAFFVHYGFIITAIIISLVIAFTTKGFFVFTNQIVEDPFTYLLSNHLFCVINTNKGAFHYGANGDDINQYRTPSVTFQSFDNNSDGLYDSHVMSLEFPMGSDETVFGFQAFVGLNFQMRKLTRLQLQDYAYFEYSGSPNAANISVTADVSFQQKYVLNYKNYIFIQLPTITPSNVDSVLDTFYSQPASLVLKNQNVKWTTGRSGTESLKVDITLKINPSTITYKPGFWYTTKWAWIQFASIAIFMLYLQQRIKEFLFFNKYIPATVISDLECTCMPSKKVL